MVGAGFQLVNTVAQVIELLTKVLHPTYDDNEDTLIQMVNAISQCKQMIPQLMQKMQQMPTLMSTSIFWRSILEHGPQFWPILALLLYHYQRTY